MNQIKINAVYKHFKGDYYFVKEIIKNSETDEDMVLYYALYGKCQGYVRPLKMFLEKVDKNKYPNSVQEYRFELTEEKSKNIK